MRFLPPEEHDIVVQARALGLEGASPGPAYLSPRWCTALSLCLIVPTFGYSLIVVPLLWVIQHDRTAARLARLRLALEEDNRGDIACQNSDYVAGEQSIPLLGTDRIAVLPAHRKRFCRSS